MRTILLVFIMVCSIHFSYAQKGKLLSANDPLVAESGMWQYTGEKEIDLGDPHAVKEDLEEEGMDGIPSFGLGVPVEFVGLIPEKSKNSMFAAFLDPDYGFACPNYFIAHKTKKTIEGKFLRTCAVELEGMTFSIRYKYKKKKDTLYLQYKGKWHSYKRYIFK